MSMHLTKILGKAAGISLTLFLIIIYLKLGWFRSLIFPLGLLLLWYLTWQERAQMKSKLVAGIFTVSSYFLFTGGVWMVLTNQHSYREYEMTWETAGINPSSGERIVSLYFTEYPGFVESIHSDELAEYLLTLDRSKVDVTFIFTAHLWCEIGHSIVMIEDLTQWQSSGGGSGYSGYEITSSPFRDKGWWCP